MLLHELDKWDYFTIDDDSDHSNTVLQFDHTDGMYSVCWLGENIMHISVMAPVKFVKSGDRRHNYR